MARHLRTSTVHSIAAAACLMGVAGAACALGPSQQQGLAAMPATPTPTAVPADTARPLATEQIRSMEQQVELVLGEARNQQEQLARQRQRLATAESVSAWLPWLLLAWLATVAVAVWLGLRARRLQQALNRRVSIRQAEADFRAAMAASPGSSADASMLSPGSSMLSPGQAAAAVATAPDLTIAQPRMVAAAAPPSAEPSPRPQEFSLGTGVPPRPVSVEELLDLDQQVDFFMVLGQEQAAIDLLLAHVRATGGTSALPYFKLLEIYRQQGDEEAYERTRERFNQRFNAFAPDWSAELMAGRSLESYGEVVQRLQRAWPQPLRAVAELDSLLLRRADLEPFDLPAYREVLMLHALVRDLPAGTLHAATTTVPKVALAAEPAPAPAAADGAVDLLLPLDDELSGLSGITAPRPHVSERASAQAMLAEWVFTRATAPRVPVLADAEPVTDLSFDLPSRPAALDLDLSELPAPPREFTRPVAFTDIDLRRDGHRSDLGALDDHVAAPPLARRP